jgi:hypothetical protein
MAPKLVGDMAKPSTNAPRMTPPMPSPPLSNPNPNSVVLPVVNNNNPPPPNSSAASLQLTTKPS